MKTGLNRENLFLDIEIELLLVKEKWRVKRVIEKTEWEVGRTIPRKTVILACDFAVPMQLRQLNSPHRFRFNCLICKDKTVANEKYIQAGPYVVGRPYKDKVGKICKETFRAVI